METSTVRDEGLPHFLMMGSRRSLEEIAGVCSRGFAQTLRELLCGEFINAIHCYVED